MEDFKDAVEVNKLAFSRTVKSIKYYPMIVLVLIITNLINYLAGLLFYKLSLVVQLPYLIGVLRYLVDVATLSLLMSCLYSVIIGGNLNLKNFTDGWNRYMSPLMSIKFIFWLIEMAVTTIFGPLLSNFMSTLLLGVVLGVMESPLLEAVYIGEESGTSGFMSILDFLKNNVLQWIIVSILFTIVTIVLGMGATSPVLLSLDLKVIIKYLLGYIVLAFIYIYKGHLYSILYNSSVRKRKFMGVFE